MCYKVAIKGRINPKNISNRIELSTIVYQQIANAKIRSPGGPTVFDVLNGSSALRIPAEAGAKL